MPVKVIQIEVRKFKAEYNGVEIVSGRVKEGGTYAGLSPSALMASALGLCTGMHVAAYLEKEGYSARGPGDRREQQIRQGPAQDCAVHPRHSS